jgi:ASC-1-like (ASCH) protein
MEMEYDFLHHRHEEPFENMKKGLKKMEIRLFDEKRQQIKIGDIIKVVSQKNSEDHLYVNVIGLSRFLNFNDLYEVFGDKIKNYEKKILSKVYPEEKVNYYGILVIHFEIIDEDEDEDDYE